MEPHSTHDNAVPVSRVDDVDELRARLAEAEETLNAIRHGEVDGLLVFDGSSDRVYTLRSADAPYRALIEQMGEGAATLNEAGQIVYCNRRFADLVETPMPRVTGKTLDDLVDVADRAALSAAIESGSGKVRTRLPRADGPGCEVHISVSTVTLDNVESRAVIVTDLSMLAQVQRESRSKDEFLAMLAHELRNPLGAIAAASEALKLGDATTGARGRGVIERQVRHMARLLDDLLDLGRVVTGKISLERRMIDLAETVRSCVSSLTPSHPAGPRVDIDLEPAWVYGDAVRLDQIVGNLVSNALKFTPAQNRVAVSVRKDGTWAVLLVQDEGRGISPEALPFVFDLFVQADTGLDRSRGGLGIGLTLVRRLVELHGGTVEASSQGKGRGSMFTVRLPVATNRPLAAPPQEQAQTPAIHRVLVVEDLTDAREMHRLVLEAAGHQVFEAMDGASALETFRRVTPDVVMIDIGLPGMNGHELARSIRSEPDGDAVLLVALTGYGFPEDRERSRRAGFDIHFVKPVDHAELRRILSRKL
jgi:signal transduction histidine kinase